MRSNYLAKTYFPVFFVAACILGIIQLVSYDVLVTSLICERHIFLFSIVAACVLIYP